MNIPLEIYSKLPQQIFHQFNKTVYHDSFVEVQVNPFLESQIRNFIVGDYKRDPVNNLFSPSRSLSAINSFIGKSDILPESSYKFLSKDSLNYFKWSGLKVIPTTGIVNRLSAIVGDYDNVVEFNAGSGRIGECLKKVKPDVMSYDMRQFEIHKTFQDAINNFEIVVNIGKKDKTVFVNSLSVSPRIKDYTKFLANPASKTSIKQISTAYLELPVQSFYVEFIKDLHALGKIHLVDKSYRIYISEVAEYLTLLKGVGTGSSVFEKTKQSKERNFTGIEYLLNSPIRIYHSEFDNYSNFVFISFLNYALDLDAILPEFMEDAGDINSFMKDENFLFTSYEASDLTEFKNVDDVIRQYDNFIFEQLDTFYKISFEDLLKICKTEENLKKLLVAISEDSSYGKDPDKSYIQAYSDLILSFQNNFQTHKFLELINYDLESLSMDEIKEEFDWLNIQFTNQGRLLILVTQKYLKYHIEEWVTIPIRETVLSMPQLNKMVSVLSLNYPLIHYPETVLKGSYKDAIKSMPKNGDTLAIGYSPGSKFSLKDFKFDYKKLNVILFASTVELLDFIQNDCHAGLRYRLYEIDIISAYAEPILAKNSVLVIISKKSDGKILNHFGDLKILKQNF